MNHVAGRTGHGNTFTHAQIKRRVHADGQPSQPVEKTELAAVARKQRYAGLRGKCCGTRVRGSVPQPQSSSLALPCQILVSVDGCQSLAAFGSCIHWMRAPSRRPITPAGTVGKAQGGLPFGQPAACQISPIAMQQWGFKHEKSRERKKGCHLWMASFLRFIAANLSLTHAVTAVSPR